MCNTMSTHDMSRDSRSPTLAPPSTNELLSESTNDASPDHPVLEGKQDNIHGLGTRTEPDTGTEKIPALQNTETTTQTVQQIEQAQNKGAGLHRKDHNAITTHEESMADIALAQDQDDNGTGIVDMMQAAQVKSVVKRSREHQSIKSVTDSEQLSNQTNALEQVVSPNDTPAPDSFLQADQACTQLTWSEPTSDKHLYITPVSNPEVFPVCRIQVVQAEYYPSAHFVNVWTYRDIKGEVVQVTADMQDGPINHVLIDDVRIITALGLRKDTNDTISLLDEFFRPNETFTIHILPGQRIKNLKFFVVGRLQSARHAYLHWLDSRGCADPKHPPYVHEARHLARQSGRRALDVWREINGAWQLEQGSGGRKYRENRFEYLGEDPMYAETTETSSKATVLSMWH
jgi:hypothetical protein